MKSFELKIARELLGLSQAEAAQEIGNVSVRSWNYWESGDKKIPLDVKRKIEAILEKRRAIIRFFIEKQGDAQSIAVVYYNTPEYCQGVLDWRFSQSLARTLALDFGAKLIEFKPDSYFNWLEGHKMADSQQARSEWAVYQSQI